MIMGPLGRAVFNGPLRARNRRRHIVPTFARLGGSLEGCRVLEVGAGGGGGAELILDVLGAATLDAVDLDPVMVGLAASRLRGRAAIVQADMLALPAPDGRYDAVVDIGALHDAGLPVVATAQRHLDLIGVARRT